MLFADRFDQTSANQYADYATTGLRYRRTAQALLEAAGDLSDQAVLELGCRSGVLTSQLAAAVGPVGSVIAIDDSHDLLVAAKEYVEAPNVRFILNDEDDVDSLIAGGQDTAFSNAAFWQYDTAAALEQIHRLLRPRGRFFFNLSGGFFDFKRSGIGSPRYDNWPYTQTDVLNQLVALAHHRFPTRVRETSIRRPPKFTSAELEHIFKSVGFTVTSITPLFFEIPLADELAWLQIPAWTADTFENLDLDERQELLATVIAKLPANATFIGKWVTIETQKD